MHAGPVANAPKHAAARGRRVRRTVLAIVLVLVLAVVGVGAWLYSTTAGKLETIATSEVISDYEGRPAAPTAKAGEAAPMNILFLGSDSRAEGERIFDAAGNRTDSILLAHVSGDRQHIDVISVMRDSWVDIPGYGEAKINAAFSYGGAPLLVRTLEGLLGQRIDHIALIDFAGFKEMTTALGGVTVNNDVEFSSKANDEIPTSYYFPEGEITLEGEKALAFVRERYAFADGDYQRVRNQQKFLKALMAKTMSRETLSNPLAVARLAQSLSSYIAVDSDLASNAVSLASSLSSLDSNGVRSFTLPTSGTGSAGGQSVVFLDEAGVAEVAKALADDTVWQYHPSGPGN